MIENNYVTAEDLDDMFGCPDPESDGPMCEMNGCTAVAEFVGLDSDGETKILVCKSDSYNGRLWGVWPIENDSEYGVAMGASGKPIYAVEVARQWANITDVEYDFKIEILMDAAWDSTKPGVSLDKIATRPVSVGLFSHA